MVPNHRDAIDSGVDTSASSVVQAIAAAIPACKASSISLA
jgi:hypothetical protein